MTELGFSQAQIAERLGCSVKQIQRVQKKLNIKSNRCSVDPEQESHLRSFMMTFSSAGKTAGMFGVSRQALLKQ